MPYLNAMQSPLPRSIEAFGVVIPSLLPYAAPGLADQKVLPSQNVIEVNGVVPEGTRPILSPFVYCV